MLELLMQAPPVEPKSTTASFLFADIAGFTALTEVHGDAEAARLVASFCDAVEAELPPFGGTRVKTIGDALMLHVPDPGRAILLGLKIAHDVMHGEGAPAVRVGLHHGPAIERDGDYYGAAVNRCARLRAAAYGGQVLLSAATTELVRHALPERASLRPLGGYRLRTLGSPERVTQLLHPDLRADFPPLRSLDGLPNDTPLTRREREVIALVARGYSNRQMADSLVLAVSTVERHVANILGKLSLSSRAQVTAWAAGQALPEASDEMLGPRFVLLGTRANGDQAVGA
jgi:class 3 adenylate cyclase